MKPVYLCGRGLACALGLNLGQSLAALRRGDITSGSRFLYGAMGGHFPYQSIPLQMNNWNERACELVQRVASEAGVQNAKHGTLFIATSSFDIGAVEQGIAQINYDTFANKVAAWLEWTGPVYVISTACTSSLNALIAAHALLGTGEADEAVVLGFELDNKLTLGGFAAMQLPLGSAMKASAWRSSWPCTTCRRRRASPPGGRWSSPVSRLR